MSSIPPVVLSQLRAASLDLSVESVAQRIFLPLDAAFGQVFVDRVVPDRTDFADKLLQTLSSEVVSAYRQGLQPGRFAAVVQGLLRTRGWAGGTSLAMDILTIYAMSEIFGRIVAPSRDCDAEECPPDKADRCDECEAPETTP